MATYSDIRTSETLEFYSPIKENVTRSNCKYEALLPRALQHCILQLSFTKRLQIMCDHLGDIFSFFLFFLFLAIKHLSHLSKVQRNERKRTKQRTARKWGEWASGQQEPSRDEWSDEWVRERSSEWARKRQNNVWLSTRFDNEGNGNSRQ